jgi:hypothetical protein
MICCFLLVFRPSIKLHQPILGTFLFFMRLRSRHRHPWGLNILFYFLKRYLRAKKSLVNKQQKIYQPLIIFTCEQQKLSAIFAVYCKDACRRVKFNLLTKQFFISVCNNFLACCEFKRIDCDSVKMNYFPESY